MRRRRAVWGKAVGVLAVVALVALVVAPVISAPPAADAAPTAPFAPRRAFDDNGAIALVGNNLLVCADSPACANARQGIGTNLNNNSYQMVNLDVDGAAFPTFNSSNSQLLMPDGSTALWAGLYWGARFKGERVALDATAPKNQMKLLGPTDAAYQPITSTVEFGPNGNEQAYQEFADVTATVRAQGNGTWWGADVSAGQGDDRYAGWASWSSTAIRRSHCAT
jgi:hypothetical protein